MLGWLALAMAAAGRRDDVRGIFERLESMAHCTYVPATSFAWACLGLGNVDGVFDWLNRAIDARDRLALALKTYAFLDPLRSDPRFAALLRRMNLDE